MIGKEQNSTKLIIDIQYFGTVSYIKTLFQFSNIEIDQYESYQKMSFRNRCLVAGSNGLINLSVPLEKGRDRQHLIKDTRISYSHRWQAEHLRTIESCYSRAPFFEFYSDGVGQLLGQKQEFLLDLNLSILDWLKKVLKLPGEISLTESYRREYPKEIIDLRNHFLPKNFQDQLSPRYTQVFEDRIGFQPNLSILDLLFCMGPTAWDILNVVQ